MVFVMVQSDRSVVVLLHKCLSSWLSIFCNSLSIIMNCMYANTSTSNVTSSVNSLTFFKSAYYVQHLLSTDCLSLIFHLDPQVM